MDSSVYIPIYNVIQAMLWIYGYTLMATAVISWLPELAETQFGQVLNKIAEPYLILFRRFVPPLRIGGVLLDLSYLIAVISYFLLQEVVLSVLSILVRG